MIKLTMQGTPEEVRDLYVFLLASGVELQWASDMSKPSSEAKWCSQKVSINTVPELPQETKSLYGKAPQVRIYERRKRGAKGKPRSKAGYVYLMPTPGGEYKIGRTTNIQSRRKTFSVKFPFEVQFVAVIQTDNAAKLEKELHRKFSDRRMGRSEFFKLTAADVQYIQNLNDKG